MAKPEWGSKHSCQSCGAKYYDLRRNPIVCPKCGTTFNPDTLLRSRRSRPAAAVKVAAVKVAAVKVAAVKEVAVKEVAVKEVAARQAVAAVKTTAPAHDVEQDENATAAIDDKAEDLVAGDDEEEEPIEDASEVGEDKDDLAEVIIGGDEKEDT